jgi:hypothetical protein
MKKRYTLFGLAITALFAQSPIKCPWYSPASWLKSDEPAPDKMQPKNQSQCAPFYVSCANDPLTIYQRNTYGEPKGDYCISGVYGFPEAVKEAGGKPPCVATTGDKLFSGLSNVVIGAIDMVQEHIKEKVSKWLEARNDIQKTPEWLLVKDYFWQLEKIKHTLAENPNYVTEVFPIKIIPLVSNGKEIDAILNQFNADADQWANYTDAMLYKQIWQEAENLMRPLVGLIFMGDPQKADQPPMEIENKNENPPQNHLMGQDDVD